MADSAYQYRPLPPGKNRILSLLPAAKFIERIEIKLLSVDLDEVNGVFEALSYTWGVPDPDPSHQVFCDGQSITVTPNRYEALQVLRDYGSEGLSITFWIGQIIINQSDYEEKNSEATNMRDTYAAASNVMVWSPKKVWEDEGLVDACIEFSKFCNSLRQANEEILPHVSKETWQAMVNIYGSTPYFRRVWIIQEILCSKES